MLWYLETSPASESLHLHGSAHPSVNYICVLKVVSRDISLPLCNLFIQKSVYKADASTNGLRSGTKYLHAIGMQETRSPVLQVTRLPCPAWALKETTQLLDPARAGLALPFLELGWHSAALAMPAPGNVSEACYWQQLPDAAVLGPV